MLVNTGETPLISNHGLLTTVASKLGPNAKPQYALEGSVAIAGAAVKWLRDSLQLINSNDEISSDSLHLLILDRWAEKVSDSGDVYFVPAFSGLLAPYWRSDARGAIVGMTQYTNKSHICRSVLDAVCYQTKDVQSHCVYPYLGSGFHC
jgi:glycerol kinase